MKFDARPRRVHTAVATSVEAARANRNKLRELVEAAALTDAQIVALVMAESNRP